MHKLTVQFLFLAISGIVLFTSCAKDSNSVKAVAEKATEDIGCAQVQSKIFDSLYAFVDAKEKLPESETLSVELSREIENQLVNQHFVKDLQQINEYKTVFIDYVNTLIFATLRKFPMNKQDILQALIELELQDQTAEISAQTKLHSLREKTAALNLTCPAPPPPVQPQPEDLDQSADTTIQQKMSISVNNVVAVAYQSCRALEVPPVDEDLANVQGITVLSEPNPENGGIQRIVSSASKVRDTHPYVRVASPGSGTCYNVRGNPLIYDFGGKPKWSSSTLDFFSNSGSGTVALGMDCSGFVGSVLSALGARYAPGVDNKPVYVNQKSDKFIDAKSSGFKCFDNISLNSKETIKTGDIAAVVGHVVIVDSIGADPFGLRRISSQSKCSQVSIENFDFVIAQSSPSKNGMGINKFKAKDYLKESPNMAQLFIDMAKASCTAAFTLKTVTPKFEDYGIIRHKGTKGCLAPKVTMAKQSCVSACLK